MTTKDKLVQLLQAEGYDTWSACEHADTLLKAFRDSNKNSMQITVGGKIVLLERKGGI